MDPTTYSDPHRHIIEVTEQHLDNLGHVNNARYLEFFEAGRTQWYRDCGLLERCRSAHDATCDTVVVNVNCDFVRECHAGERLIVLTSPSRLGRKSFAVSQQLETLDAELAARAVVTSVVMDLQTRRAIELPASLMPLFGDSRTP